MDPDHLNLLKKAQAQGQSGNAIGASESLLEFLNLVPGHVGAWVALAGHLLKLGKVEKAQNALETSLDLDPHNLSARVNLAAVLMRRGQFAECQEQLGIILKTDARRVDALLLLAQCLLNLGDLEGAQQILDGISHGESPKKTPSALQIQHAELWAILSLGLFEAQKFGAATDACHRALQLHPRNFTAGANLGSILMAQGDLTKAEEIFRELVANQPARERGRLLLITCLSRKGDLVATNHEIESVLRLAPTNFTVHKSVLATFYNLGFWEEYRAEIERFRIVDPTSAHPEYEHSFVDLLFGDMLRGWRRYEARLRLSTEAARFAQPAWDGKPFAGKTLLLWAEQGFGDTFMFIRYLPHVKALGGRIILETQPALETVAATSTGADLVVPKGAALPPFDLQLPLMSLPFIFETDLSSIPAEIPYLDIPSVVPHQQELLERLTLNQESTRIGIVWAGRSEYGRDFERSLPAAALAPLEALPGVAWFSLQLGREGLPPLPNLVSLASLLKNFADTAYALSALDLVITVDTSVAHLAGALGVPTFLLLPFQPDFRWMLNRHDSPWYPTMRLYRQPAYGDWESVIRQVVVDLTPES
ncbi:MAG: tetratricopeptide repeat protein [Holophaga sp.]|nr:tetratricopeptide repeat protein [Holophaga sp.]